MVFSIPSHFGVVEKGIYRCAYPEERHLPWIQHLGIRTIVLLSIEVLPSSVYGGLVSSSSPSMSHSSTTFTGTQSGNHSSGNSGVSSTTINGGAGSRIGGDGNEEAAEGGASSSSLPPSCLAFTTSLGIPLPSREVQVIKLASLESWMPIPGKLGECFATSTATTAPVPATSVIFDGQCKKGRAAGHSPELRQYPHYHSGFDAHDHATDEEDRPPFSSMEGEDFSVKDVMKALVIAAHQAYHPVLLTCPTGELQTTVVVGCLRQYQHRSISSILQEGELFLSSSRQTLRQSVSAFIMSWNPAHYPLHPQLNKQKKRRKKNGNNSPSCLGYYSEEERAEGEMCVRVCHYSMKKKLSLTPQHFSPSPPPSSAVTLPPPLPDSTQSVDAPLKDRNGREEDTLEIKVDVAQQEKAGQRGGKEEGEQAGGGGERVQGRNEDGQGAVLKNWEGKDQGGGTFAECVSSPSATARTSPMKGKDKCSEVPGEMKGGRHGMGDSGSSSSFFSSTHVNPKDDFTISQRISGEEEENSPVIIMQPPTSITAAVSPPPSLSSLDALPSSLDPITTTTGGNTSNHIQGMEQREGEKEKENRRTGREVQEEEQKEEEQEADKEYLSLASWYSASLVLRSRVRGLKKKALIHVATSGASRVSYAQQNWLPQDKKHGDSTAEEATIIAADGPSPSPSTDGNENLLMPSSNSSDFSTKEKGSKKKNGSSIPPAASLLPSPPFPPHVAHIGTRHPPPLSVYSTFNPKLSIVEDDDY